MEVCKLRFYELLRDGLAAAHQHMTPLMRM